MRTYFSSILCFISCEHSTFKTKIESKYRWVNKFGEGPNKGVEAKEWKCVLFFLISI